MYSVTQDKFSDLTLDESSVDHAIETFGAPTSDKKNVAIKFWDGTQWFKSWFIDGNRKAYRRLIYKNIAQYEEVTLYFSENRLVFVSARLKSPFGKNTEFLSPNSLKEIFDVEFKTFRWAFGRKLPPFKSFADFNEHRIEKGVPFYYLRIGVGDKSVIANLVDNNNPHYIGSPVDRVLSSTYSKRDEMNSIGEFPGYVSAIHLISRRLVQ